MSTDGGVARLETRVSGDLVDRADVLGLAARRWAESQGGTGQFVLVAGEAGIGKTRILDEVGKTLDAPTLTTRAWPRDAEVPGAVILDLARELRREGDDDLADVLSERLMREDDTAGDAARRHRLLVGDLSDLLITRLSGQPMLLRIEDLHWADELSLEILERLAPMVRRTPSLILATYRSDEVITGSALAAWRTRVLQQRFAEEVRLERLSPEATARLAESLLGRLPASDFLEELHERSNGIPLHIEELIAAGGADAVPQTVAEAVRERTARLDPTIGSIVGAAAVIGCSFEFDLLAEVAGEPEAEVDRALRTLREQHLMVALSDTKFDFRHALIRDALYEDMAPFRKRTMHAAVARVSEAAGLRRSYLSEQYELAQLPGEAYAHAVAAGMSAAHISAHREAAELFERAMRTLPDDAAPAERAFLRARLGIELAAIDQDDRAAACFEVAIEDYLRAGETELAARLTTNLMNSRHLTGVGLEPRIELANTALSWLDEQPDGGPDALRGRLLGAIAAAYLVSDRLDEARETAERAAALLDRAQDLSEWLGVQTTLGATKVFAGDSSGWEVLEQVRDEADAAEYEAESVRARRMLGSSASVLLEYERGTRWIADGLQFTAEIDRWNDYNYLLAHRAHVRWATGAEGAERDARQALVDGRGITTEIQAHLVLGFVRLSRGNFPDATAHLEHALQLGEQMNEVQRISPALWGLAEVAVHEERLDDAIALCERGYALSEAVGDASNLFPFVVTGTRTYLAARDNDGARSWLDRCGVLLRRRGIPGVLAALDHAEGLTHQAEGRVTQARELLDQASTVWDERGRIWEGLQALLDLARCAVRGRRAGEATRLAADARRRAIEAGATLLVRLADDIKLDPTANAASGPLTAREFEVARLIAEGATNREIAERLVIAPKTASTHVEHILAKLGVSRRAEIAAWVSRS